jgi:hypothetical protein
VRGVVVHQSAIWWLRDGAPVEVLVLQVGWSDVVVEWLLDGLEVGRCLGEIQVVWVDVRCEIGRHRRVKMTAWRSSIAEILRIDEAVVLSTEGVVKFFEACEVHFAVAVCTVDVERTGKARVRKRRIGDFAGHLGREEERGSALKWCNRMLCYRDAVDYY